MRVCTDAVTHELSQDARRALHGALPALKHEHGGALAEGQARATLVKGAARLAIERL